MWSKQGYELHIHSGNCIGKFIKVEKSLVHIMFALISLATVFVEQ